MKLKIVLLILCSLTLAAVFSATAIAHLQARQNSSAATQSRTFHVRGLIRSVDVANKIVRITHEEVPGYMAAMTMPLCVKDVALLKGLEAGDSVGFDLAVTADDSWVSRIEKISAGQEFQPTQQASVAERETERIQPGELVPDFTLTDQDGRTIHLSDYRGKAVVLTFIYTRCPLPNFCPLMSKNFSELEQRLSREFSGKFHLLSISMDPAFDRPEVLKQYASRYNADLKNWSFATGDAEQIRFVANLTGLYYAWEGGLISHDLRTALIGPDGRLVQLWKSNVWTPYEVQRIVAETLTMPNHVLTVSTRAPAPDPTPRD